MFSQMVKGVLEGCILAVIRDEEAYGYEIMEKLVSKGFTFVKEGSIYPLLLRLEKEHMLESTMRPSASGPNRKYYRLTLQGQEALTQFGQNWKELSEAVNHLLESGK